jgi:nitrite reductase/ring-hydroxylating ferredoxin subunit
MAHRQTMLVEVGAVEDFAPGRCRIVQAGAFEIGVVRWTDGRFFALRNRCPHQGGPICAGRVGAKLVADAGGEIALAQDAPVITCAWHHWEFDLATGRSVWNERIPRLQTFPTTVSEDGRVLVEIRGPAAALPSGAARSGAGA